MSQHQYFAQREQHQADFQHDPDDIDKIIRPILEDKADCVFGSRFLGGLQYKMPFHRAIGNRFFSWVTSKFSMRLSYFLINNSAGR